MSNYNEPTFPLYQSLCILPINKLFELQLGTFIFQHKSNALPKPLTYLFMQKINIHDHNTRERNSDKSSLHFLHKAPDIWHNHPQEMKQLVIINAFTNKFKHCTMKLTD